MCQLEIGKETLMQFLSVCTPSRQPGAQGRLSIAEYFFDCRNIHANCQQMQYRPNRAGECFQVVMGRMPSHRKLLVIKLAAQVWNSLVLSV